ncbi:Hypothetical protein CINCED_3A012005 [Cinara cedri]|uniref:Uncharacterized protein n=1 Tax=Cinara cedri TaxID=506608 RepID=A0A5E4MYR7_9HEMI|nr:Hypothetical protein CINCED_3A012005 [Cinara cedri]
MSNPGTSLHAGVKVRQGLSMFTPVRYDNPASITASTGGLLLVGPKYLRDDPARPDKTFHKTHQELSLVYLDSRNFKISRPMYVLNLTRQPDNVSGNRNNIILNAEFNEDVPNEVLNTNPITYKIKDLNNETIEGSFYSQELQTTKF